MHFDTVKIQEMIIRINIGLCGYNSNVYLSLNVLTFSSSESFQHVFVCGTIWPSIRSASWLCETFREPHGSPSSFSFHDGRGDNRAACDVTRCARSEATKEKAYMHTSTACHSAIIQAEFCCCGRFMATFILIEFMQILNSII